MTAWVRSGVGIQVTLVLFAILLIAVSCGGGIGRGF